MRQSHADLQDRQSTILAMQRELDERAAGVAENILHGSGAQRQ